MFCVVRSFLVFSGLGLKSPASGFQGFFCLFVFWSCLSHKTSKNYVELSHRPPQRWGGG